MQSMREGTAVQQRGRAPSAWQRAACCVFLAGLLGLGVDTTYACGIDGIPSMSMNGHLVTINHAQATKQSLPYWAPFLLGANTERTGLRFTENVKELHRTLDNRAFATPFRWTFGDGAAAKGLTVNHRYGKPGWYRIDVSYYYTPQHSWIVFDSAELHVVNAPAKHAKA
jgi:hypothetical protein